MLWHCFQELTSRVKITLQVIRFKKEEELSTSLFKRKKTNC
jgi:hypothetical protein